MFQYRIWVLIVIVAVQGCATVSPDPCRTTDWYAIGYDDGLAGRASGPQQVCAADIAQPELGRYRRGRDAGLAEYCEPQNGFTLGMAGHGYHGACRGDVESEFLRAYQQGKRIHDVEVQIRRLDSILAVNESERDRLGESLRQKQTEMGQPRVAVEGQATLRDELRELEETVAMVKGEIEAIQAALSEQHAELALLRQGSDPW